jgi:hypothetical protein
MTYAAIASIFCSNSASSGIFPAIANEAHFSEADMHLKLLDYTFVSFSDPCNKVNTEPSFRSTTGATPP